MTAARKPALTDAEKIQLDALKQTRWWESAVCIGAPFDLFDTAGRDPRTAGVARARALCARCPVSGECRQDADLLPDPSFRAGFTASERHRQNRGAA